MANVSRKQEWDWFKGNGNALARPSQWSGSFPLLSRMQRDMEQIFGESLRSFWGPVATGFGNSGVFQPNINIAANDTEYTITVEAPGVEEKDFQLNVSPDGVLTVSGEKRQGSQDKDKDYQFMECSYGSFQRSLSLPDDINQDAIKAGFKNGVLTITCPRTGSAESARRQIPIGSGRETNDNRTESNKKSA